MLRRSLVVFAAVALTACVSSSIDPQSKASMGSVYVEPVQLSKASVFAPNSSEANASSGKVPATVSEATSRLQEIVDTRTNLRELIESQAKEDLISKGYRVTDAASGASAKLKINVYNALSVPVGDGRGIAMTVSAEMVRSSDGKRLMFAGASQIKDAEAQGVRMAPYAEWFTNEDFLVEQYRLVARLLTAQALAGL
ncbi:hypothetical protein EN745_29330 [Mesorhizobium sp. M4A.F.Ca.ET.022.05.2.1]|uniref:hypothetical protein n=2 Tax=unclassified Mesorhizobium TaxID=325217 RepID=UPI000FD1F3C2|nr:MULTISPECIES: hypothetical protein [unclassified Mesorhizobium]RVC45683.1 hypothetical protein EN781_08890 [Mesorhizobium sp. M4A.F.Ca.ET.090.04.2.1]RVC74733.1 hypothetical protein EN745_29330 [Mesorhizobium sp. M4A.F.Ca.ET.022.05.2.1]RWD55253.1 MAG: hypothetical protein EOS75_19820 [Mesorhizobium sp.]TIW33881.1 MAG: hypothetical protein E5V62_18525 [Mesorhizobium sp.]TJX41856.1 MAG: hypothetical protein E5W21_24825 [Mesorhizobium sp.]